ncbi:MAG: heme exporter protein CcmD [Gammaproteobacteria bacterium]
MNFASFLSMGGYATYVWGSIGATVLVLAANVYAAKLQRRRVIAEVVELSAEKTENAA